MSFSKTKVCSWNEWDPLKHVIVGRADGTMVQAPEPGVERDWPQYGFPRGTYGRLPQEMEDKANAQLDNFANIQSSWVTQGLKIGQLALLYGANDMGSLMLEENVVAEPVTIHFLTLDQIRGAIAELGFLPRQRNVFYELVDEDARAIRGRGESNPLGQTVTSVPNLAPETVQESILHPAPMGVEPMSSP